MLPPPVACVLMNAIPLNSDPKMMRKEMPTLIPDMPVAALSLCAHYRICLHFLNAFIPLSVWQGLN